MPEYEQPFELKVKACGPVMELRDDVEPATEINSPDEAEEAQSAEAEETNEVKSNEEAEVKDLGVEASVSEQSKNSKEEPKSFWLIFIISFLSGFAALLTPCVFPREYTRRQ